MTRRAHPTLLLGAIVVTLLAWASAFIVIRGVAPEIGGGALALGRVAVGTLALGILAAVTRSWLRPTGREWALLALYGIAWFGAYNVTLNLAEATLDAGTTAMIVNIGPLLIALGAGLFLGEGVPRWLLVGAGVSFSGVVLIGVGMSLAQGTHLDAAGIAWALASAVTYAVGVLAQKPVVRRLPAVQVTFLGCLIGMLACLPFAGQLVAEASVASPAALAGVVYLGLVPTALAFTTWSYALARMPAGKLGVSTYIVPPLTVIAGWLVFAEVPTVLALIGGVLCLAGVAVSRRPERVPAAISTKPGSEAPGDDLASGGDSAPRDGIRRSHTGAAGGNTSADVPE